MDYIFLLNLLNSTYHANLILILNITKFLIKKIWEKLAIVTL